jgi:hypothetical protein
MQHVHSLGNANCGTDLHLLLPASLRDRCFTNSSMMLHRGLANSAGGVWTADRVASWFSCVFVGLTCLHLAFTVQAAKAAVQVLHDTSGSLQKSIRHLMLSFHSYLVASTRKTPSSIIDAIQGAHAQARRGGCTQTQSFPPSRAPDSGMIPKPADVYKGAINSAAKENCHCATTCRLMLSGW